MYLQGGLPYAKEMGLDGSDMIRRVFYLAGEDPDIAMSLLKPMPPAPPPMPPPGMSMEGGMPMQGGTPMQGGMPPEMQQGPMPMPMPPGMPQ